MNRLTAAPGIAFDLPMPPSVNGLFATVGKRRVKSRAYKAWIDAAGWSLKAQHPECITERAEIRIYLSEAHGKGDADNRIKPCLDLLTTHSIIADDNKAHVRKVSAEWCDMLDAECRVEITPDEVAR